MTAAATTATPMVPDAYRVTDIRWELADTYTLELEPESGNSFAFKPGQIAMIYVFGAGEVPISVSSSPRQVGSIELTIRASGYVTKAGAALKPGDSVGIRGPFGEPWPMARARGGDVMVVAGGIGLAPLRSVVYEILDDRGAFGNVSLVYGSRNPESLLYESLLHEWRARFDFDVEITVDRASRSWHGDVGLVTQLLPRIDFDPKKAVAMVCGPEIMMKFVGRDLVALGMSADDVFVTMERNMKCGIGLCGHCQLGPEFLCKDGPVFPLSAMEPLMRVEEL